MPVLQMIPTKQIVAGDNPRGTIDVKADGFKEFCGSIEARGILQPILVGPAEDGKHTVIAGHRRHAAATTLKLAEIPAMVTDVAGSDLIASLTENIQREDLSPVAEAKAIKELQDQHGFTQVQAGEALSKSERWVRERLRILNLPGKTQKAYDEGALPLESLVRVEKLAEQAPKAAEALAEAAASDDAVRSAVGGDRIDAALDYLGEEHEDKPAVDLGCMVRVERRGSRVTFEQLKASGASKEQLGAAKNAMAETVNAGKAFDKAGGRYHDGRANWVELQERDVEAAQSFGCLLEVDGGFYITDVAWLSDRFIEIQKRDEKELRGQIAELKSRRGSVSGTKSTPNDREKEQKRKERAAEQDHREQVHANNLELGQRAQRALEKPRLSAQEAELLALIVVGGQRADDLGARGLVYCYHDFQTETSLKNGRKKVEYAKGRDAGADLISAIKSAKTAEEKLGLALRACVLSAFADEECVAPSNRSGFSLRYGNDARVLELVEAIALDRNLLPDAIRADAEREKAIELEKLELYMLLTVKRSRAKAGINAEDLIARSRSFTSSMVDAAVQRRHLKEHSKGDVFSYTLTGAGKKRLEKLEKAEKERRDSE